MWGILLLLKKVIIESFTYLEKHKSWNSFHIANRDDFSQLNKIPTLTLINFISKSESLTELIIEVNAKV